MPECGDFGIRLDENVKNMNIFLMFSLDKTK
jgi:hypothetical protein